MCTVTYMPTNNGCIITSNRDENIRRGNTLVPKKYLHNNKLIEYPKDEKGNGTWIASSNNNVAVLLNGAFKYHKHQPPYKHSRGIIIPEILSQQNPLLTLQLMNLDGVEPFTLILLQQNNLFECRWDENILHKKQLDINKKHCWNSATLYSKEIQDNNALEFNGVIEDKNEVLNFHNNKKYELQLTIDSLLNNIKTISISQVIFQDNNTSMMYYDLLKKAKELV